MIMQSPILPISQPSSASSSSASSSIMAGTTTTVLLRREESDQSHLLLASLFDDDKKLENKPFLSRASSYSSNNIAAKVNSIFNQKRRRRTASDTSLPSLPDRQQSSTGEVEHAAAETYLITRLSIKLLRFLGVRRSIIYGDQPRNRLDLYLPKNSDGPKPVVAFVTGGAWIIGYKAWGSLLGMQLSERDIIVACIDYRNFPQGTMGDMVKDASQGISFVCKNIAEYGGDPNRIYLMGQSAGAHIAACALVEQAIRESGEGDSSSWSVSQIQAYFGLSGGYNLFNLVDHFHGRGLYRSIFLSIMEGEESLRRFSPEVVIQDPANRTAASLLPPIVLFHGTADYSIPSDSSKTFAEALQRVGSQAEAVLYEGKTHTDLFLQDPMRGGSDALFEDIVSYIHKGDADALAKDAMATPRKRLVPEFMLKLARKVSPF